MSDATGELKDADYTRKGIEVAVQIRDLGDRDDMGTPQYYTRRQYLSETALASSTNDDLVESATEMALLNVISEWRSKREVNDE